MSRMFVDEALMNILLKVLNSLQKINIIVKVLELFKRGFEILES